MRRDGEVDRESRPEKSIAGTNPGFSKGHDLRAPCECFQYIFHYPESPASPKNLTQEARAKQGTVSTKCCPGRYVKDATTSPLPPDKSKFKRKKKRYSSAALAGSLRISVHAIGDDQRVSWRFDGILGLL